MSAHTTKKPTTGGTFLRTLVAAVAAALINNAYSIVYTTATGFAIPDVINPISVTIFSVAPVIFGGIVYWIASRFSTGVANVGLFIGTIVLFVLFTIPSFAETIQVPGSAPIPAPEGFSWLSFGLHFAGPIMLLLLVPRRR